MSSASDFQTREQKRQGSFPNYEGNPSLTGFTDAGLRPNPDPSILTTQNLQREVSSLKEIVFTRLEGMDKAIELFNDNITRVPTDTDKQISHLKELHNEKFQGVEKQFLERDVRTEQAAIATKIAVDAALQAQKEAAGAQNESNAAAIAKSEAATTKQIDGIMALLNSVSKAQDEKFTDLKGRLDRGEGKDSGQSVAKADQQVNRNNAINLGGVIIAALSGFFGLAIGIALHFIK